MAEPEETEELVYFLVLPKSLTSAEQIMLLMAVISGSEKYTECLKNSDLRD
jgi:hypothetical protein